MDRYALAMQFTSVVPIGLTASGLRLDIEFTGTVTDGPLEGAEVNGIDFLLIRPDGVAVIDARERFTQDGGTVAYAHVRGFGDNPLPVSDLT
ncbi:MAG TPA: DUF3237 family protein, partial [Sporichthya sp.]|nr:DUF3237 family protein [Sporichthya sp.]